ncbi:Hypothetical_protein [Hexamita inflata]|uniref:Hypothetical_protein n=1 Tax=Hexamita inflata TaxID=28002 RepID=A0AA86UZP1_9EUKA|nr:Hypothetical protein HINF_LOCUS62429 [Hexamita inflata]
MHSPTIPKSPVELQFNILKRQFDQTKNDLDRVQGQLSEETKQTITLRQENADLYDQLLAQINAMPQVSAEDLQALKQQNDTLQAKIVEYEAKIKLQNETPQKDKEFEAKLLQIFGVPEKAHIIDKIELIIEQNYLLLQLIPKKEEMERIYSVQKQLGQLVQLKEKPTEQNRAKFMQALKYEVKQISGTVCVCNAAVIEEAQSLWNNTVLWKNMDIQFPNSRQYFAKIKFFFERK